MINTKFTNRDFSDLHFKKTVVKLMLITKTCLPLTTQNVETFKFVLNCFDQKLTENVKIVLIFWFKSEISVFEVKMLRCPLEILPSKSQTYTWLSTENCCCRHLAEFSADNRVAGLLQAA